MPVKRVNTSAERRKKTQCVSFLRGPLSNCYSNLCLCVTEPAAAAGERGRGSGPSRAAGGAAAVGEAARKPHRGAGAAETCCYICWVKHGLCCDLKRVLKTHSSVAFLKEMKASHSFWCTGLMKWLKECRIFFFRKCPQSLLIARGGIFNWTRGNTGEANPLIIIHIFPQMNLNQTWRGREMSGNFNQRLQWRN